jgi:hypothetical protein
MISEVDGMRQLRDYPSALNTESCRSGILRTQSFRIAKTYSMSINQIEVRTASRKLLFEVLIQ